jgi:hypothetical protein
MPNDEHFMLPRRGADAWDSWRAERDDTPDLSQAGLRGLDLSGYDLSRADLRGADLAGAFLNGAQFLNSAQLVVTRNWQSAFRDEAFACGASIPNRKLSWAYLSLSLTLSSAARAHASSLSPPGAPLTPSAATNSSPILSTIAP